MEHSWVTPWVNVSRGDLRVRVASLFIRKSDPGPSFAAALRGVLRRIMSIA